MLYLFALMRSHLFHPVGCDGLSFYRPLVFAMSPQRLLLFCLQLRCFLAFLVCILHRPSGACLFLLWCQFLPHRLPDCCFHLARFLDFESVFILCDKCRARLQYLIEFFGVFCGTFVGEDIFGYHQLDRFLCPRSQSVLTLNSNKT